MTESDIRDIEAYLFDRPDLPADPVTERFSGQRLPGLFPEQLSVDIDANRTIRTAPGQSNRRALAIKGADLYGARESIAALVRLCCEQEPDVLWQFILMPLHEEPLDLLEFIGDTLKSLPGGMLDRFASARAFGLIATRRLMVRLRRGADYDPGWVDAVELYLAAHFM